MTTEEIESMLLEADENSDGYIDYSGMYTPEGYVNK